MSRRAYVDANVLLRVLTGDPPEMLRAVQIMMRRVEAGEVVLVVHPLVVAELVWVLRSFYRRTPADIADALLTLSVTDGIEVVDKEGVERAIRLYARKNVDFIDAYLAVCAERDGSPVYTFDANHFRRLGVEWQSPDDAGEPGSQHSGPSGRSGNGVRR